MLVTLAARVCGLAAQVPISDLTPGEPQDLWLDLGKPESRAVNNPLDVGVQARPLLPGVPLKVLINNPTLLISSWEVVLSYVSGIACVHAGEQGNALKTRRSDIPHHCLEGLTHHESKAGVLLLPE